MFEWEKTIQKTEGSQDFLKSAVLAFAALWAVVLTFVECT